MAHGRFAEDTLLVVRVPYAPDTVHYRAYAETLEKGSVLDWVLSRFLNSKPSGMRVVCVCATERERSRALDACSQAGGVLFVCLGGQSGPAVCRQLMDTYGASRLIMGVFGHAVAPVSLVRDVLRIHEGTSAHLTDADAPAFVTPLYVIEAAMADRLMAATKPGWPNGVVAATSVLFDRARGQSGDIRWQRLKVGALYGIDAARWPEAVSIESATDVSILKEAMSQEANVAPRPWHFLDAWKRSSRAVRQHTAVSARTISGQRLAHVPTRPVRVLYVSTLSHYVGASESLCHLIDGLDRSRFEPVAAVPYAGVLTDELRRRDVTVVSPNRQFNLQSMESVRLAHQIIEDVSPDLVHVNHTLGLPLATLAAGVGMPLVQHIRLATPDAFKLEIHAADAIISVSEFVRQRIIELDIDPDKITVILDGINPQAFKREPEKKLGARQRLGIPAHEFVVSVVSRMNRQKRIETIVKAVARLRRAIGRGHLLLVGLREWDAAYDDSIANLIQLEGLGPHTTRLDFTLEIPSVLHAADTLALLSVNEALARVVVEAMAVGLAVVVGDSGGSKEVIDHGRTGFVVPCGDVDALASVFTDLAQNPERAGAIGVAAAEVVRASLTDAHCAAQTMELYERVLDRFPQPRSSAAEVGLRA